MEEILKKLGWKELYPDTLNRLRYFRDSFRAVFTQEEISDEDLESSIAKRFAIYDQTHVYDIYCTVNKGLSEKFTLTESMKSFVDAFKETIPAIHNVLDPDNYIDLYLEYHYAAFIKNKI